MPTASNVETFAHLKESLKYFVIYASKNSLLSFKIFTERLASCSTFELLRILFSFAASASVKRLNVNLCWFLWKTVIASAIAWFFHFKNAFRVGWSISSDNGSAFCDSGKFRLVTILEKKSFKVFATFCSSVISSSSSSRKAFFWTDSVLGEKWFNCFPIRFIVYYFVYIQWWEIFFFLSFS